MFRDYSYQILLLDIIIIIRYHDLSLLYIIMYYNSLLYMLHIYYILYIRQAAAGRRPGPAVRGIVFHCAEGRFLSVQKARLSTCSRRPKPWFSFRAIAFRCGEGFAVAKATFWRLQGRNLELVSCRFRKQR